MLSLNPRTNPEQQELPEVEFIIQSINRTSFEENDIPRISIESFISTGDRGAVEFLAPGDEGYDPQATTWISGTQNLINLEDQATNDLDFNVNIPDNQAPGSYTSALVFRNEANEDLGHYLIIINVGHDAGGAIVEPKLELEAKDTKINLTEGKIEVVLRNMNQWHIDPLVRVSFVPADDEEEPIEVALVQDELPGILPDTQQLYAAQEDNELFDRLLSLEDLKATVKILEKESLYEMISFDISDSIISDDEENPDDEDENEEEENEDEALVSSTTDVGDSQAPGNFLQDNLIFIIGGFVLLVIMFAVGFIFSRKNKSKLKTVSPANPASPSTTFSPASVTPFAKGMPELPVIEDLSNNESFSNDQYNVNPGINVIPPADGDSSHNRE